MRLVAAAMLMPLIACAPADMANQQVSTPASGNVAETVPQQDAMRREQARVVPIPPIPAALRGCWEMDDPDDRDNRSTLRITATAIEERASWRDGSVVATPELVEQVAETRIEGRFSAPEGDGRMTVATMLSLGPDTLGTPAGQLRLSEGDAGSRWYSRCKNQLQDAK